MLPNAGLVYLFHTLAPQPLHYVCKWLSQGAIVLVSRLAFGSGWWA
jgi:hypothetical protein